MAKDIKVLLNKATAITKKKRAFAKKVKKELYTFPTDVNYVLGIDPGLTGAVCFMHRNGNNEKVQVIELEDCPLTQGGLTKKDQINPNSKTYDLFKMYTSITRFKKLAFEDNSTLFAFIEKSQAMSKGRRAQGAVSNFTIGYGYGLWLMALAGNQVPYFSFAPRTWTSTLFPKESEYYTLEGKARSIAFSQAHYPTAPLVPDRPRCRAIKDGRADAICIAHYGVHQYLS